MLERYTLTISSQEARKKFNIDPTEGYKPVYNGSPTHLLPVITQLHPEGFSFFYWGLPPEMTKNKAISSKLINAEVEQIQGKVSYKNALNKRRCLIPADGFYIWKKISKKGKVPYRFIFNNQQAFLIAGIWEEFDSDNTTNTHTFSMITVIANKAFKSFTDTTPAIIKTENIDEWLDIQTSEARLIEILRDQPNKEMGSYPVSSLVNNIHLNNPELIEPTKPVDQFGNYSLFD